MERRQIAGGGLVAAGAIVGSRTAWWIFEQALAMAATGAGSMNWAAFPARDALATALVLLGIVALCWPRIQAWRRKPSLEKRTFALADLTAATFEKHMILLATQAGAISELKEKLRKAGID